MGVYQSWIVPALTELSMRNARLRPYRERVARAAQGRVLDVGIGSGLNLPFYGPQARDIFGLDPSPRLLARAQDKARDMLIPVRLLEGSAERIPLADRSMDTIVLTWTDRTAQRKKSASLHLASAEFGCSCTWACWSPVACGGRSS
jgi:ubiquinone/menaquinone biosynthesis C-methylase UbiE